MKQIQAHGRLLQINSDNDTTYGLVYSILNEKEMATKHVFVVQGRYGKLFDIYEQDISFNGKSNTVDFNKFQQAMENMIAFYEIKSVKRFDQSFPYDGELLEQNNIPGGKLVAPLQIRTYNIPQGDFIDRNIEIGMEHCQVYFSNDTQFARVFLFNKPEKICVQLIIEKVDNLITYIVAEMKPDGEGHIMLTGEIANGDEALGIISGLIDIYSPKSVYTTYANGDNFLNPEEVLSGLAKLPSIWI